MTKTAIELLAPAKNLACAIAAINSGADAIYIGGPSFGARVNASNSLEEIKAICDYAHLFKAKVHVTLNTILDDKELELARKLAFDLYDIGVDALIIQDLGLINGPMPPLELHASTQQNNSTPEKVAFLEKLGFDQVVLARELSINEIANIKSQTNVRLEGFIHGALCVGISGRCYLSAALTNRSANRGECAQLCRVKQSLYNKDGTPIIKDKYLLSLKDLNQTKNIAEFIKAGVRSFKIEGRLKEENYVRNVTAWYRQHIDNVLAQMPEFTRSSYGETILSFEPDVSKSFNRGFTEYNAHEIKDNYASFDAPGYIGTKVATLEQQKEHLLTLKLNKGEALHNGDSLNYYDEHEELNGFRISRMLDNNTAEIFQTLPKIKKGTIFFRNKDADFEKNLTEKSSIRKLKLTLTYEEKDNQIILYAKDETGTQANATLNLTQPQIATDLEKLKRNLNEKLARIGDTVYSLEKLNLKLTHNYFVPISQINDLRRTVINKLAEIKLQITPKSKGIKIDNAMLPIEEQNLGFKANIYNDKAKNFYLTHGAKEISPAYESTKPITPQEVLVSKHCLRFCIGKCPIRHKVKPIDLVLEIGNAKFDLSFDCKKCLMSLHGPIKIK